MSFPLLQFDRESRYRPYPDWPASYVNSLKELASQSPWRNQFHIEPETGLLNDPNGFSYFNGQWHLFYQYYPYGPVHGLKSWYHLQSKDLVHWEEKGITLFPNSPLDSHGAYSGSAIADGDQLRLFYTGNVRDENWVRSPLQNTVTMDKNNQLSEDKQQIIPPLAQATEHFRDPMYFKHDGQAWMVIGGQKLDETGTLFLYQNVDDALDKWDFHSELAIPQASSAYMFECPNINFLDGKVLVVFCPQGISQDQLDYQNIYPNAYVIADGFTQEGELINPSKLENLDYGFDVYATQLINSPDGRVLGVSWLGLPEIDYPSDDYGYQGALSLIKNYQVIDGVLHQYPVEEMLAMRVNERTFDQSIEMDSNSYEYEFKVAGDSQAQVQVFAGANNDQGVSLSIDTENGKIKLDRKKMGTVFAEEFGETREVNIDTHEPVTVNIFADTSVLEIFINKGAYVFSSRIFTDHADQRHIFSEGTSENTVWSLQ